jgi:DNA-binding response OmpR family regulator
MDKKITILIVDDETINIEIISQILEQKQYRIVVACNGQQGLRVYEQTKPSIIIADINMPQMDGIEMVSKIRQNDHNTKVIFLTAHDNIEYLVKSASLKLTKYIFKPIKKEQLLEAVEEAIGELREFTIRSNKLLQLQGYTWDFKSLELSKEEKLIPLTPKEKQLLQHLLLHVDGVVSYDDVAYALWDGIEDIPSKQTLKTIVTNIRKKTHKEFIHNVYAIGYKILTTS